MAFDLETTFQRAQALALPASTDDEQAELVALFAMTLTLLISKASDPDGAEELAIEAGSFVEQRLRAKQEPASHE